MNDDFRDEPSRVNLDGRFASDHPDALLPAFAAGSLDSLSAGRVRAHLGACGRCQRELAEWRAVGTAVRDVTARAGLPRPVVLAGALATIARDGESQPRNERIQGIFERMKGMVQSQNKWPRRSMVAAAVAAALAVAIVFTPVGSYAQGVLTIFTPQHVAAVPVSEQDLQSLPKLNDYGTFTAPSQATSQQAATAAAASSISGYKVLVPASLPSNVPGTAQYIVQPGQHAAFTFSAQKAQETAAKQGKTIPAMPANLDGSTIQMTTKPAVIASYSNGTITPQNAKNVDEQTLESQNAQILVIGQMPAPVVTSTGASAQEIEQYLLAQPGIPTDLAQAIRAIGDPQSTLPIPVPVNRADSHTVTVQGVQGLAVADQTGLGGGIIWEKDGNIYGVGGTYTESELLQIANSLQ